MDHQLSQTYSAMGGINLYNEGPLQGLLLPFHRQTSNAISANLEIGCKPLSFATFQVLYNSDNSKNPAAKRRVVDKNEFLNMSIQAISTQSKLLQNLQISSSNGGE